MWYAGIWRNTVGAIDLAYGSIILLGGHAGSSYQMLLSHVCPFQVFAFVLVVVGGLLISRSLRWGGVLGAAVWMSFAMASLVTVLQHTAESDAGPSLLVGFAMLHLLITYGAAAGLAARKKE
jgi:hypothetical protein